MHLKHLIIAAAVCLLLQPAFCAAQISLTIGRAFPLRGEKVTLGARYEGEPRPTDLRVSFVEVRERLGVAVVVPLGKAEAVAQDDGSLLAGIDWVPEKDGFHTVRAIATVGGRMLTTEKTIPVVQREVHFVWYGSGLDLKYASAITPAPKEPKVQREWRDRGVRLLAWKGVGEAGRLYAATPEDMAKYWLGFGEADGIAIDEIGNYDRDQVGEPMAKVALDALAPFKQGKPKAFLAVWHCGSLTTLAANAYRQNADLVMMECYLNYCRAGFGTHTFQDYIDQRVLMARRMDVLQKCVIGFGITNNLGGITPAELIGMIEHYRRVAPECPGIAWYKHAGPKPADGVDAEILRLADEAAIEYFVKPCLMIQDWEVQFVPGKPGRLCVNVHNIGAMNARDINVAFYQGHPEQGGKLIGKSFLPYLDTPKGWSKKLDESNPADAKSIAYGINEAVVPWSPASGYYDIYVRIHSSANCTVLSDLAHNRVRAPIRTTFTSQ